MKEYILRIEDEMWEELESIKKNTGAPFVYIIRRAIDEYIKRSEER
jgi:predicted DNA-binding protein